MSRMLEPVKTWTKEELPQLPEDPNSVEVELTEEEKRIANEVWSGPTHYLPNFETRLDDMSDEEFEELIKKGEELEINRNAIELEEIITSLSKDKNATYRELTEEEKAINREVWGEDNITLV
ncbi:hypothetical protein [Butyricimonas synergistica]|uniref:hypothetical protein n=1 Tax=Butyricimonas synergistica TaxID=544644 RepID=UPI0022E60EB1|nr:hypothetical protein [Butyricimonas synergistica]